MTGLCHADTQEGTPWTISTTTAPPARRCTQLHQGRPAALRERTRQWWQWHWTRVAEEHGYAEALTAVLLEAVALLTRSIRLRYAAHEFLAVYVAVLKTLRHRGAEPGPA